MSGRYWEEFEVGDRFRTAGYTFTEAAIIDFAFKYDPQPFHLDVETARETVYGGLIASGFHTLSVCFRLIIQVAEIAPNNIGGRGVDDLRWPRAVRPGDTLRVDVEVIGKTPSSHPERGNLRVSFAGVNQRNEAVVTGVLLPVVRRRPV